MKGFKHKIEEIKAKLKGKGFDYETVRKQVIDKYHADGNKFDDEIAKRMMPKVEACKRKSYVTRCVDCEDHPSKHSEFPCKIARFERENTADAA